MSSAAWALLATLTGRVKNIVYAVTTSVKQTDISRLMKTFNMSWGSLAFWTKEPVRALNAYSCCRYKSDERSLLYFFVSFVTWSCKSQSDRVISCSGNKNEKSPIMFCRDLKRVCNCIMHLSTTGKKPVLWIYWEEFPIESLWLHLGAPERHAIVRHFNPCKKW